MNLLRSYLICENILTGIGHENAPVLIFTLANLREPFYVLPCKISAANSDDPRLSYCDSFKITDFSTNQKAMRLCTSQYQKRMHISYRLPNIEDSYVDFHYHDGVPLLNALFWRNP